MGRSQLRYEELLEQSPCEETPVQWCRPQAGKEPGSPGTKEICGSKPPQKPGMMVNLALRTMTLGEVQRRGRLSPRERKVKLSKSRRGRLSTCARIIEECEVVVVQITSAL